MENEIRLGYNSWFLPPLIIIGGPNLKNCQNVVGTKFFLTFLGGDKPLWGKSKLYGGSNIY